MFRFANSFKKKGLPVESKTWQVAYEDLEFHKTLGEGNFGTVFHGTYFGTDVAIKKINDDEQKYLDREVIILKSIRHPNIVQLMGVCEHSSGLYLVTELLPGGTLRKKIKNLSIVLPWNVRLGICIDMARALTFLHSKEIIHRDLKSKNVLLDEHYKVKICDFGLARTMDMDGVPRRMTVCGTDDWMAPEVAAGGPYTEMADVFSFGVILLEVIFRQKPNQDCIRKSLLYGVDVRMAVERKPKDVPDKLFDLAVRTCAMDWSTRPQMAHCLQELKATNTEFLASEAAKASAAAASTDSGTTQPAQPPQSVPSRPMPPASSVAPPMPINPANMPSKPLPPQPTRAVSPPPQVPPPPASSPPPPFPAATAAKPPPPPPPLPEPRRPSIAPPPPATSAQEPSEINDETLIELALKASFRRRSTIGQRPPDLAAIDTLMQAQSQTKATPQPANPRASNIPAKPAGPPPPKPPPPRPNNPPPQIPVQPPASASQGSSNAQPAAGTPREKVYQTDRPSQSYRVGGQGPNSFEIFVNPMVGAHGQIAASDLSTYDDDGATGSSPNSGAKNRNDPRQSFVQKLFGKGGDH